MAKDDDLIEVMLGWVFELIGWIFKMIIKLIFFVISGIFSLIGSGIRAIFSKTDDTNNG